MALVFGGTAALSAASQLLASVVGLSHWFTSLVLAIVVGMVAVAVVVPSAMRIQRAEQTRREQRR